MARVKGREATITAFLDAAIESLIERGYAGTTTSEISRRAGASPGLFVRYWPTKADLLVAAAAYAQRQSLARFEERWTSQSEGRPSIRTALSTIIELFDEPAMRCLAELEVAARTDPELAVAVAGATASIDDLVLRSARRIAPQRGTRTTFDQHVRLVLNCARGLAQRNSTARPAQAAAARAETLEVFGRLFDLSD